MEASRLADSLRTRFIQANTQFHLLLLDSRQALLLRMHFQFT